MILKGTRTSGVMSVIEGVTEVQVEPISDENWLREAGLDPATTPAIQLISYQVRGEWESGYFRPGQAFLMNDTGKTVDRF